MIGLLFVAASALALGSALVSRAGVARTRLAHVALAFSSGLAALSLAAVALCALGLPLSRGMAVSLGAAGLVAGAWHGRDWPRESGWPRASSPLERCALWATLLAVALVLRVSLTTPLVSVDGRTLWTYHARLIADAGTYPAPELRDPGFLIPHAQYPPLLPMAEALVAVVAGGADERVLRTVPTLFAFAVAALLFAELPRRDPRWGVLLAACFALLPTLILFEEGGADAGVADTTLACFVLASVVALEGGSPLLAGFLAAAAALTKNEGLVLGLLLCVSAWLPRRRPWLSGAAMASAFAALVIPWWILRASLAAGIDERYASRFAAGALAGLPRGLDLALEMLKTTFLLPHRAGLLSWLLLALLVTARDWRAAWLAGRFWIVPAFFAAVWVFYVVSPWPGVTQVQLSFPRILLQVTPLALFALTEPPRAGVPSR